MTDQHFAVPFGRQAGAPIAHWRTVFFALTAMLSLHGTAIAEPSPIRGGTLVFAVDAEPPNYDTNFSFVFIHPVIPNIRPC